MKQTVSCAFHTNLQNKPTHHRTDFWRVLSWQLGDRHANRICWLVDLYCWWANVDPARFHRLYLRIDR